MFILHRGTAATSTATFAALLIIVLFVSMMTLKKTCCLLFVSAGEPMFILLVLKNGCVNLEIYHAACVNTNTIT